MPVTLIRSLIVVIPESGSLIFMSTGYNQRSVLHRHGGCTLDAKAKLDNGDVKLGAQPGECEVKYGNYLANLPDETGLLVQGHSFPGCPVWGCVSAASTSSP